MKKLMLKAFYAYHEAKQNLMAGPDEGNENQFLCTIAFCAIVAYGLLAIKFLCVG